MICGLIIYNESWNAQMAFLFIFWTLGLVYFIIFLPYKNKFETFIKILSDIIYLIVLIFINIEIQT